jgi:hypothetical protein
LDWEGALFGRTGIEIVNAHV